MIISKTSWHYKLLNSFGWISSYRGTSLCPYFWKLVTALTLTLGIVPYLAMGMGLDAYAMFSPGIDIIYTESQEAAKAAAEVAEAAGEVPIDVKKAAQGGISLSTALMIHWGIESAFLDWFLSVSMIIGILGWLVVGAIICVATFFGIKISFGWLNDTTGIGTKIGSSVGSAISRPARATGSIFSAWWKAHKEQHCPLIEFVEED